MIKISILKNNVVTNSATFKTQELADAWLAQEIANNTFGLPERPELNELGEPTGVILPAEYTIEIVDISAEIADQADSNKDFLAEVWSVKILASIRKINRKKLRDQVWGIDEITSLRSNVPMMQIKEDIKDGFFGIAITALQAADVSLLYTAEEKAAIVALLQQAQTETT